MRFLILLVTFPLFVPLLGPDCAETEIDSKVSVWSVALEWTAEIGTTYQVYSSDNLLDWSAVGQPVLAESEEMFVVIDAYEIEREFYKVGTLVSESSSEAVEVPNSRDVFSSQPTASPEKNLQDVSSIPSRSIQLDEEFRCNLSVHTVAIEWSAWPGERFQLYASTDLNNWVPLGGPIRADRYDMQVLHEVYASEERLLKVHELRGTPDLVVRNVWIEPWPLMQGEPFRILALVQNRGDGTVLEGWSMFWPLPHFWVRCSFEIDGASVGYGQVDFYQGSSDLDPGELVVIGSPVLTEPLPSTGFVLSAAVDPEPSKVWEIDEGNNLLNFDFFLLCLTSEGCGQVRVNGVLHDFPYSEHFPAGAVVELDAVPCFVGGFTGWEPLATNADPITIVMNHDFNIKAFFQADYPCRLYLEKEGEGNGYVLVNGVPRTLPWTGLFNCGSSLTLAAVHDPYSLFLRWSGDPPAEVVPPEWIWQNMLQNYLLDRDKSLTVRFQVPVRKKGIVFKPLSNSGQE